MKFQFGKVIELSLISKLSIIKIVNQCNQSRFILPFLNQGHVFNYHLHIRTAITITISQYLGEEIWTYEGEERQTKT